MRWHECQCEQVGFDIRYSPNTRGEVLEPVNSRATIAGRAMFVLVSCMFGGRTFTANAEQDKDFDSQPLTKWFRLFIRTLRLPTIAMDAVLLDDLHVKPTIAFPTRMEPRENELRMSIGIRIQQNIVDVRSV